ncbi:MAG: hypothetical protein NTZ51_03695 [Proteobacteria bacterium]|nr:hypothetical protein [Pseudomonadota bacterium]
MKIFDVHIHTGFNGSWLKRIACCAGVYFTLNGLMHEMTENNGIACASMG